VHTWFTQLGAAAPHCAAEQQLPGVHAPAPPAMGAQQTSAALPVHVPASALVHATAFVSHPPVVLLQMKSAPYEVLHAESLVQLAQVFGMSRPQILLPAHSVLSWQSPATHTPLLQIAAPPAKPAPYAALQRLSSVVSTHGVHDDALQRPFTLSLTAHAEPSGAHPPSVTELSTPPSSPVGSGFGLPSNEASAPPSSGMTELSPELPPHATPSQLAEKRATEDTEKTRAVVFRRRTKTSKTP
jgi:hypothetical protein